MAAHPHALVEQGRAALTACDWPAARACFEQALTTGELAEALDGLGQALYWMGEYPRALEARERAYALFHERGENAAAAAIAVQLAMLHGLIYGNDTAANGWMSHARRRLDLCAPGPEHGWFELFLACTTDDADEREERALAAIELGRAFCRPALEFDALCYVGKARVERGLVADGMRLIDEAVAATTSGLVDDPWAVGEIYCTLFHACELAIDVRRADAWLWAVGSYVERTRELPVAGICRMHYGGVLKAAGRWQDAERELLTALEIYESTYRGTRYEPLLRVADLRARQGLLEEAERLLAGYEDHPLATEPRARVHLARREPHLAAVVLERHLVRRGAGLSSAPIVALLVAAHVASGEVDRARVHARELAQLALLSEQPAVRGLAALSQGRVAAVTLDPAVVELFDDALVAFTEAETPYELALTRLELARALDGVDSERARVEARMAAAAFTGLGATCDADAAAQLLRQLGDRRGARRQGTGTLTGRELEVLALLGVGLSNADIAQRLYISQRTAEHHVSNILAKLGLTNRAAAAAYALRSSGTPAPR